MKKALIFLLAFCPYLVFSQKDEAKVDLMYTSFEKGYEQMYLQKDSAYAHLHRAFKLAIELGDYESSLGILDNIALTADYHQDLSKLRDILSQVNLLLSDNNIVQKLSDPNSWNISYLMWLAAYHFETKEYVKAKDLFIKARAYLEKIPVEKLSAIQADQLYTIYSSLGTNYMYLTNYELAELNFLRSIKLVNSSNFFLENLDAYLTSSNQSIAQLYTRMGKYDEANEFNAKNLQWSQENYRKDKKFKNNLINAYQQITLSYVEQDSLEGALSFLEQSKPFLLPDDPFYKDALILYGDIYTGLNENGNALNAYLEALSVFTEFRNNTPHQDIAKIQGKIAELHLKQRRYQEGLKAIQEGFNAAGIDIQITDLYQNPNPNDVFSKTQLLNLLDIKLQLLQGNYEASQDAKHQKALLQTSRAILTTFDLLKSEFDSKLDKQFLAEKAYPIFHRLMQSAYSAYQKEATVEILELALNIAEKNKDFVLLEALRNSQATEYGEVPITVLEKESQLRAEITNVEKQLFNTSESDSNFSEALFELKQEYYAFLDMVKFKYPEYHQLKYQNRTLNLGEIRAKALDNKGALISYSMTEDDLYAIVINDSKQDFLKMPFGEADREAVRKFYRLLSSPSINGAENEITEIAGLLFEKIVQLPLADFDLENLTIIPDGELHYLPFDLLQENGAYLLETKSIGYGNSVSSLLELMESENSRKNNMLAYAPSFSGTASNDAERQFGKLLYNDNEVQKIAPFFDSETILKQKATLTSFKANASRYNIVHLATHASANDQYPDYSYLAFSEVADSTESNILYIKDLYNMTLPADMVTLSACQTGIGKLQKGQGMLSLSKGFYYAGAKSLVNTLWKINDKSTVKLMEYFYEALSKGQSKTAALRTAKLKYLETTDDPLLKHPYYWAAFVVSGDVGPISNPISKWWWSLLAIPVFATIVYTARRKKSA